MAEPNRTILCSQASSTDAANEAQFLIIVNTFFSLVGSTLSTFACSALTGYRTGGRKSMMHIQVGLYSVYV